MKNTIFEKVNQLLEQYIGGQIFFTELDKAVKFDKDTLQALVTAVNNKIDPLTFTIASGEIGLAMHNLNVDVDFLVPGGLRFDPSRINLEPFSNYIKGNKFIFIDDSYFSGKTAMVIKEEVERLEKEQNDKK